MSCCHNYYLSTEGKESVFSVDISSISFGHGALKEAGEQAKALGMSRVALFTDKTLRSLPCVAQVRGALEGAGLDVVIYDEVKVEPTDRSFLAAAKFAAEGKFDGYVSVGGGSVIDTCKAANLYATWPAISSTTSTRPSARANRCPARSNRISPAPPPAAPARSAPASPSSTCSPCR